MRRAVTALLMAALVFAAAPLAAEDVRIGYVDMRQVLTQSEAGAQAKREIEGAIQERQEGLRRDEQRLRELQQDFEKNKLLLSEEQRSAREQEFQQELREFQQARAAAQREVETREREYTRRMLPVVREVIAGLAKENGLTLVFEKNEMPVLYAADGPDLTEEVIRGVNARQQETRSPDAGR